MSGFSPFGCTREVAAVEPDRAKRVAEREQRDEPVLRRRPVTMRHDWRAPCRSTIGGLRDTHVVRVFRGAAPLEPMRGESLAGHRDDRWKVRPIDEEILALRDGARRRPPVAIERREAKRVRGIRGGFEPREIRAAIGPHGKVRLTATSGRGRSKRFDGPERNAAPLTRCAAVEEREKTYRVSERSRIRGCHALPGRAYIRVVYFPGLPLSVQRRMSAPSPYVIRR